MKIDRMLAIIAFSLSGAIAGCGGTWNRFIPVPENLYSYDGYRILEVVPVDEFSRPSFKLSRNASGTKIIVTVEDHMLVPTARRQRPAAYVLDADGGNVPKLVDIPEEVTTYWLDDNAEVFAWRTGETIIQFADGSRFSPPQDSRVGFCDAGRFMYLYNRGTSTTSLYKLPDVENPIVQFEATKSPIRVYSTPTKLLIFGGARDNPKWADKAPKDAMWGIQIYEMENGAFVERGALPFPQYGYLVDVDPRSNLILVRRDRDLPLPHEYYLQDIETHKVTQLGPITHATFMFLEKDIFGEDRLAPYRKRP